MVNRMSRLQKLHTVEAGINYCKIYPGSAAPGTAGH
jgi:hypothetical protein